ncbi:ABC transporter permease subunit [Streptomyces sp. NBC_00842]|uniref:ABC transporter permease subunit n=1 Tax=Streptomyces sp. NBC_00842 TaxID=2975848 RepID=UPI0038661047|nr:branched-chain amino acid ABC transporter permease/ATP-binding protein [Streptomyces sp. NBC_00842]
MSNAIHFAILGMASGGLYALMALGLIVVHRTSGAINFAHGAIAVAAGYVLFYCESNSIPTLVSVVLGILSGLVLGVLIQLLVMTPLRNASTLTKAISTLGILVVLQASCQMKFGSQPQLVKSFLPQNGVTIFGAYVTVDYLIMLGIALVLAAVLWVVYRRTRFGLATTAVSDNEEALGTLGWSSTLVARGNWAIAGTLAALSGVLLAPTTGVSLPSMTSLLLPALAAALFGGLSSFPVATLGALLIGVIQSELTFYGQAPVLRDFPNLPEAVPFLLIIVILVARGKTLPTRDFIESRLPALGSGRVRLRTLLPTVLVAVLLIQWMLPLEWVMATTSTLIAAIIVLSLVLLIGYAGQLSLAQLSIGGLGALATARLVASADWPLPLAVLVGLAAAVPVGILVGLPAVRTRGATLAVVTLGLAAALNSLVFSTVKLTGGDVGLDVGFPSLLGFEFDETTYPRRYALVALALFVLVGIALCNLRRSGLGRRMISVRSNERAAASLGVNVVGAKLAAFVMSSVIATLGAILVAFRYSNALFTSFDPFQSVNYVVQSVIGGVGFVPGAAAGGVLEPSGLGNKVIHNIGLGDWLTLVGGVLLLLTVIFNPDGMVGSGLEQARVVKRKLFPAKASSYAASSSIAVQSVVGDAPGRGEAKVLAVSGLTVQFGAVTAVNGVDFELRSGEVLGVIGPNGAGKTTIIDALTGYVPSKGSITLDGEQLQGTAPHHRSRLGVIRSFQSLELFEDLSVGENLLVASEKSTFRRALGAMFWPRRPALDVAASAAVQEFGLGDALDGAPGDLSYGQRRLLAISRAVACNPTVLLLDEPAAGLDDVDRQALKALVRRLSESWGIAVLLIEHDVDLVMSVSDRILALNFGTVTAHASPEEVRRHPEVIRSYLGEDDAAAPAGDGHTRGTDETLERSAQ